MVQTADEEELFAVPRTGLGRELERHRLARLQRAAMLQHTHVQYSTYTVSRHNTLTSAGVVRDGEGLGALRYSCQQLEAVYKKCVSETDEGKGC